MPLIPVGGCGMVETGMGNEKRNPCWVDFVYFTSPAGGCPDL